MEELESASKALTSKGIASRLESGSGQYGSNISLTVEPKRRGAIYGIVFQSFVVEPLIRPELRYYFRQDGLTPKDPLVGAKPIGIGQNFTREQVQLVLSGFVKDLFL